MSSYRAGDSVVGAKSSRAALPGKVVKVHTDGTVDVCWRGTRDSTARNVDPATIRPYIRMCL